MLIHIILRQLVNANGAVATIGYQVKATLPIVCQHRTIKGNKAMCTVLQYSDTMVSPVFKSEAMEYRVGGIY
jgi:hypothetical protein